MRGNTKTLFWLYAGSLAFSLIVAVAMGIMAFAGGKGSIGTLFVVLLISSVVATQIFKFAMKKSLKRGEGAAING